MNLISSTIKQTPIIGSSQRGPDDTAISKPEEIALLISALLIWYN